MKKILFVFLIGAMIFSLATCGSDNDSQAGTETFAEIMESEGFTVYDTTETYSSQLIEQSIAASDDVLTVHFLSAGDKADADLIFYQIMAHKRLQRDLPEETIEENTALMFSQLDRHADIDEELIANTQNLSSYSETDRLYYEVMRLGNIILYVETEQENTGEAMRIMNRVGDALV